MEVHGIWAWVTRQLFNVNATSVWNHITKLFISCAYLHKITSTNTYYHNINNEGLFPLKFGVVKQMISWITGDSCIPTRCCWKTANRPSNIWQPIHSSFIYYLFHILWLIDWPIYVCVYLYMYIIYDCINIFWIVKMCVCAANKTFLSSTCILR